MTNSEDIQGGALSAGQRLSKIEDKLDVIVQKLDNKVDRAEFVGLEMRLRDIELHGSNKSREIDTAFKLAELRLEDQVRKLTEGQTKISNKIAYFSGGIAAILIILQLILHFAK